MSDSVRKFLALALLLVGLMNLGLCATPVLAAASLDDVLTETQPPNVEQPAEQEVQQGNTGSQNSGGNTQELPVSGKKFIDDMHEAGNLTQGEPSEMETRTKSFLVQIASVIFRVVCYFITAFLSVKVALDLAYIALPFTRKFLGNGYQGNPATGMNQQAGGMNGGMGGMSGGMGMGGYGGMSRGYGGMGGGYGGMNGGMGGMGGQQQGGQPVSKIQFVSTAALNAASSEGNVNPDGTPMNAYKVYAKDMAITLVVVPLLLVLCATGAITNIGFMLGETLAKATQSISLGM